MDYFIIGTIMFLLLVVFTPKQNDDRLYMIGINGGCEMCRKYYFYKLYIAKLDKNVYFYTRNRCLKIENLGTSIGEPSYKYDSLEELLEHRIWVKYRIFKRLIRRY